jgi:hypothetical protein
VTAYNLSPDQFGSVGLYHGTAARKNEMDTIDPGHPSNFPDKSMDSGSEHVFATTDDVSAYRFGAIAANNKTDDFYQNVSNKKGPDMAMKTARVYNPNYQAHVYPVQGTGNFSPDPEQIPRSRFGSFDMSHSVDEGVDAFQSRHPLTVTGPDIGKEAKADYENEYGSDADGTDQRQATRMNWMENGESPVVTQANLQQKQFGHMR